MIRYVLLMAVVALAVVAAISAGVHAQQAPCSQTVQGSITLTGQFSSSCPSSLHNGKFARYYTFTLTSQSPLTISLNSEDADTYLYLLRGAGMSGTVAHENDDVESGNTNSQIAETLSPGTYTIEATTYGEGETGTFTLSVVIGGQTAPVPGPGGGSAGLPKLSAGRNHVCVLMDAGDIECRYVTSAGVIAGSAIRMTSDSGGPFVELDNGDEFACGLTADNHLQCLSMSGQQIPVAPTAVPVPAPAPTAIPIVDPTPDPSDTGDWVYRSGTLSTGTQFRSVELVAHRTGSGDGGTDLAVVCFNPPTSSPYLGVLMLYDLVVSTQSTVQVRLSWDDTPAVTETWAGYSSGTLVTPRFHPNSLYDRQFVSKLLIYNDLAFQTQGTSRSFESDFRLHGFGNAYRPVQSYCGAQGQPAGAQLPQEVDQAMEEMSAFLRQAQ